MIKAAGSRLFLFFRFSLEIILEMATFS